MTGQHAHRRRAIALVCLCSVAVLASACAKDKKTETAIAARTTTTTAGPGVSFSAPADGASVASPVALTMVATGFTIEPAGEVHPGAGHLHVMVDVGCVAAGTVIPKDDGHLHFGKGQLTGEIALAPGAHKLCLQAGDGAHTALGMTKEISITVTS